MSAFEVVATKIWISRSLDYFFNGKVYFTINDKNRRTLGFRIVAHMKRADDLWQAKAQTYGAAIQGHTIKVHNTLSPL